MMVSVTTVGLAAVLLGILLLVLGAAHASMGTPRTSTGLRWSGRLLVTAGAAAAIAGVWLA